MGGIGGGPHLRSESAEQSQTLGRRFGHLERQSGPTERTALRTHVPVGCLDIGKVMSPEARSTDQQGQQRSEAMEWFHGKQNEAVSATTRKNLIQCNIAAPSFFPIRQEVRKIANPTQIFFRGGLSCRGNTRCWNSCPVRRSTHAKFSMEGVVIRLGCTRSHS